MAPAHVFEAALNQLLHMGVSRAAGGSAKHNCDDTAIIPRRGNHKIIA